MKAITVLNEKGGTGKTTVAVTVAAGLAARGHRVLLVDADAQGHATRALNLQKWPGLYDLLVRDAPYTGCIMSIEATRYGGEGQSRLSVLVGNVETRHIAQNISDVFLLHDKLTELSAVYDVAVIDTAPTPSLLHAAIMLASDYVLCPTLCEFWSFDGLAESLSRLQNLQHLRPVKVLGIVPMRVRTMTLEHMDNLEKLRDQFGDLVWPAVPERIVWAEASTYMVPVFVHAPDSDAAGHAWELVDRCEEVLNGKPSQ